MAINSTGFVELTLDYPATTNYGIGDIVRSGVFSAGGHTWRIKCYPRGKKDDGEYLSLYLKLVSKFKNVKAIVDAFLLRKDDKPCSILAKRSTQVYPRDGHRSWGWTDFVRLSSLKEEEDYVVDGRVRIMCGVIVLRDDIVTVPPSDIGVHLGRLLDHGDGTDVSFLVGGETFSAHRAVLAARSPVLWAEIIGSMGQAKTSCITLHGIDPATFRALLWFIYTDELPEHNMELDGSSSTRMTTMTTELLQNLLAAAGRYDLSRLKLMCAQKLWEAVSMDNVAATLVHAEMHGCSELKKSCLDFLVQDKNFDKTTQTAD